MLKMLKYLMMALICVIVIGCSATSTSESTGQYLDSSAITAKVKAKLIDNLGPKAFSVKVKTYKDEVQLSGFVNTPNVKEKAGVIAASVKNVKRVRNDLIIK